MELEASNSRSAARLDDELLRDAPVSLNGIAQGELSRIAPPTVTDQVQALGLKISDGKFRYPFEVYRTGTTPNGDPLYKIAPGYAEQVAFQYNGLPIVGMEPITIAPGSYRGLVVDRVWEMKVITFLPGGTSVDPVTLYYKTGRYKITSAFVFIGKVPPANYATLNKAALLCNERDVSFLDGITEDGSMHPIFAKHIFTGADIIRRPNTGYHLITS